MGEQGRGHKRSNNAIRKKEKMNTLLYYVILFVCIALIVIVMDIVFIAAPDKKLSENENRNLQQFPKLSFTTLTNGRFEERFEDYVADQFPGRDGWVQMKSFISRAAGKTESGGVFLAKNGYLIQNLSEPTEEKYAENVGRITAFAEAHKDLNIHALIAPTALSVYEDLLPANAQTGDENGLIDKVKDDLTSSGIGFVDVREAMKKGAEEEQMYYRTDHHWTTGGAYTAYKQLAEELDLQGGQITYAPGLVTDEFKGTLSATSGFRNSETDEIYVYTPETEIDHSVMYVYEGTKTASCYHTENLEKKDKYTIFFNGNHPEIRIESDAQSKKVLLVVKDSYANCFIPFLIPDYRTIIVVDPRYYTDDMNGLISTEGVTDVLYLYNIRTFTE